MASSYLISIILRAITKDAKKNLREAKKELGDLGRSVGAASGPFADLDRRAAGLQRRASYLKEELRDFRAEVEPTAEKIDIMGTAVSAATDAAVMAGVAFAAWKLGEKAIEIAKAAAAGQALRRSFMELSAQGQVDSQLLLESLDEAARGTISDYDLMREANEAWHLGIAKNISDYSSLMKVAEQKSRDFGITTIDYWERLTTAITSGYPAAFRQLGIMVDLEQAYENAARATGREADELSEQERVQIRVKAILAESEGVLRDWEQAEEDAMTVTQQFDAATADLTDTIKEGLLPVLLPAIEFITKGLKGIQSGMAGQNAEMARLIEETGSAAEAEKEFAKNIEIASQGMIDGALAAQMAHTAMVDYRLDLIGIDKGIQEDVRAMRMGEKATRDLSKGQRDLAEDTDDAARVAKRAQDIWHNYLTNVADENWRFTRRMEEMGFRQGQAAEDAAFRLFEIERDAGQQRGDYITRFQIDQESDLRRHQMRIRWMRQDFLDELADMEWDYQEERRDALEQSPWWIRQALAAEFRERERIAASGDKDALEQFDAGLQKRIEAIDPVYAEELEKLKERYDHEEDIERREFRQSKRRKQSEFREETRDQERQLNLQLRILERELGDQRRAWAFHDQQRLENERWAMNNLIVEHGHQLDTLYSDTEWRLSRLDPLYRQKGYSNWMQYALGWAQGQADRPLTYPGGKEGERQGPKVPLQWGMPYVPRTMGAIIHKGEAVLSAPQAERWRQGGVSIVIENITVGAGATPSSARQVTNEVATHLGQRMARTR